MRYAFALATPADDAQLRRRMAEDHMPGAISLGFRREPDYFRASVLLGDKSEIVKCCDTLSGDIVGLGARHLLSAYVNGSPRRVGYLSDLRGDKRVRGGTLLARGYRYMRELHAREPVPFYFSVIFDSNTAARSLLTGARAGLPAYHDLGRILTPAIQLGARKRALYAPGVRLRRAHEGDLAALVAFLAHQHARKQFACVWHADQIQGAFFATLRVSDFCLACRDDQIVAAVALWDQQPIRQTVVAGYSGLMRWMRPVYNSLAALGYWKALPAVGQTVPHLYLAAIAVADDDRGVFAALLRFAYNEACNGRWHYMIPSVHERDPLAEVLHSYRAIHTAGRLYAVRFPDAQRIGEQLDTRVPYVDMARA